VKKEKRDANFPEKINVLSRSETSGESVCHKGRERMTRRLKEKSIKEKGHVKERSKRRELLEMGRRTWEFGGLLRGEKWRKGKGEEKKKPRAVARAQLDGKKGMQGVK